MMHDRDRAEPDAASGLPDPILEFGVFEECAVLQCHPLVSLKASRLIPQTKLFEEAPGDSDVPSPHVLAFSQRPFFAVVQQSYIGQGGFFQPIGPSTEIVGDRDDGTAG